MIIRQIAPRQCRKLLLKNATRALPTRAFAVERPQDNATDLDFKLAEETSIAKSNQAPQYPRADDGEDGATANLAESYRALKHIQQTTGKLGGDVAAHYEPRALLANPPRAQDVTLELLLASQAHLGHSTSLWNPSNSRYIFGIRDGIHIISLDVTASHLRRAARVVSGVAERGGIILFVGSRAGQERCVVKAAEMAGGYHVIERWIPGTITNADQILVSSKLKVVNHLDEEMPGYETQLVDRGKMKPDLVVCLNPVENYVLLHECGLANIPTIGVIDTDANPSWVTYPIPANDDSFRCIHVIAGVLGRAGQEGRARRLELAKNGVVTYTPTKDLQPPTTTQNETDDDEPSNAAEQHGASMLETLSDPDSPVSRQHYAKMSLEDQEMMEKDLAKGRIRMGDNKASPSPIETDRSEDVNQENLVGSDSQIR